MEGKIKAFGEGKNLHEQGLGMSSPNEDQIWFQNALQNVCQLIN